MTSTGVRRERGAIAIEFMLVLSMLVVVFLVMLQYAVQAHGRRIATAAAEEGVAVASAYDGTSDAGISTAQQYLSVLSPGLSSAVVTASRTATTASVHVEGEVVQLVPFLPVHVSVDVEAPVERFVGAP